MVYRAKRLIIRVGLASIVAYSWRSDHDQMLDQHLIVIRLPGICHDHVPSGLSLTAIIYTADPSHLLYRLGLTTDPAFGNCDKLHSAAWRGGWELLQHQQPDLHCAGISRECTAQH